MHIDQELIRFIADNYQDSGVIHEDYIKALVRKVMEQENLSSYIENIDILLSNKYTKEKGFMFYCPAVKTIVINYEKYVERQKDSSRDKIQNYIAFNCDLLHELYHVKERKISQEEYDLTAKILKLCFKRCQYIEEFQHTLSPFLKVKDIVLLKYLYAIYNKYYIFDVTERLAYLYSYQMSSQLAKRMQVEELEILWKIKEYKLYTLWHTFKSPTLYYLEKICTKQEFKELKDQIDGFILPFEERLNLGLDLTPQEFERVLEKKIDLENSL